MKYTFIKVLCLLLAMSIMTSCHISRKKTDKNGKVVVVSKGSSRKDNGLHKGWYKNPNNPHHPRTTNPGHTKHKGKGPGNHPKGGGNGKGAKGKH